jgi:hypothetical protein
MSEGEVTKWLTSHGTANVLTVPLARDLAHKSLLGWYIAPYSQDRFCVGKLTLEKLASRHIVTDEEGKALAFPTIEAAQSFMKEQLGILAPQVFDY